MSCALETAKLGTKATLILSLTRSSLLITSATELMRRMTSLAKV